MLALIFIVVLSTLFTIGFKYLEDQVKKSNQNENNSQRRKSS